MPKKAIGGPRGAVLSIRVPARLKYGLELIARYHHESVPDVIVRAANDVLTSEYRGLMVDMPGEDLPVFLLPRVWDENEAVRLVKLALVYPALLRPVEKAMWRAISADEKYWNAGKGKRPKASGAGGRRRVEDLNVPVVEADWASLVAQGEAAAAGGAS